MTKDRIVIVSEEDQGEIPQAVLDPNARSALLERRFYQALRGISTFAKTPTLWTTVIGPLCAFLVLYLVIIIVLFVFTLVPQVVLLRHLFSDSISWIYGVSLVVLEAQLISEILEAVMLDSCKRSIYDTVHDHPSLTLARADTHSFIHTHSLNESRCSHRTPSRSSRYTRCHCDLAPT